MQRGAPRGSPSLSLPPSLLPSSFEPLRGSRGDEIGRGVLPMDVCIHRWIDRAIFTAPYPTPPRATRPSRAARGPSFSFPMPLSLPSRLHGGAGEGARGTGRSPWALAARSRWVYSQSPVCIFIYEIAGGRRNGGRGARKRDGRRLRALAIPVGPVELIKTSGIMRERTPRSRVPRAISQAG